MVRPSSYLLRLLAMAIVVAVGACAAGDPSLSVDSPTAVLSPSIVGSASVFLRITNSGKGDDALVSASVDVPGAIVELHDIQDGRMARTDAIAVPARSEARLRPVGEHIMIYKLPRDSKPGDTFVLTLIFQRSGARSVPLSLVNTYRNN